MRYSTFNKNPVNPLHEPMFFGSSVNVARYDQQKHAVFEKLIEKQISFFWRPEEVDVSRDRVDFHALTESEKHIFISNLKDRKSTRLNSSHVRISYAVFCLKKKRITIIRSPINTEDVI